jgi:HKD family nuclease
MSEGSFMRLLSSQSDIASTFDSLLDRFQSVSFAVAWASRGFDSSDRLLKSRRKIRRGVVGTDFYRTDPEFIKAFIGNIKVKFIWNNRPGVFHPKVYLFEGRDRNWSCLIGSANFTAGAFRDNSEVLMHIEKSDDLTGAIGSRLRHEIETYWNWQPAVSADAVPLERYRFLHDCSQRHLVKLYSSSIGIKKSQGDPEEIALLNWGWSEYFSKVEKDPYHALEQRIEVLGEARKLFETHGSLGQMTPNDRKGVGGFAQPRGTPWRWFGSMIGAGVFKKLINRDPHGLSNALDEIPLRGPVQREHYRAYIKKYIAVFPQKDGQPTGHGLATATRLLSMKRPDYFVCLDNANKSGLLGTFGVAVGRHDYDAYWDSIIEWVCETRWWNCRRPERNSEARVWDGRTAFLDAIYYKEIRR